jgi:metallo-beta-lactamase class B
MKPRAIVIVLAVALMAFTTPINAQSTKDTPDVHVAAAKAAAGQEHTALFGITCNAAPPSTPAPAAQQAPPTAQRTPDPSQWHAEPMKVFDNLYYVGMTEYSAWAINTSDGIIILDAIYDYSVEDEIAKGLPKVGLDPKKIKYVIVSHGHIDHAGGAKFLQDRFGAHIVMSAADWDLITHDTGSWPKPKRDIVATDGQKLTLGDTTLTLYITPGHTLGTISTLIPVKDGGKPHLAAAWGGTAFNWTRNRAAYITPERTDRFWFETYSTSAERFREIVAKAGVDIILSNHTAYDGTKVKLAALANRKPGAPHPYVVGADSVRRYLTVADECAKAGLARLN